MRIVKMAYAFVVGFAFGLSAMPFLPFIVGYYAAKNAKSKGGVK